jgi:hypothetical protein
MDRQGVRMGRQGVGPAQPYYRLRVGQVVSGLSAQKSLQFKWERDEILLPMFCPYVLLRVQPIDKCEEA